MDKIIERLEFEAEELNTLAFELARQNKISHNEFLFLNNRVGDLIEIAHNLRKEIEKYEQD